MCLYSNTPEHASWWYLSEKCIFYKTVNFLHYCIYTSFPASKLSCESCAFSLVWSERNLLCSAYIHSCRGDTNIATCLLLGWAWASPALIVTTAHVCGIIVCHLPRICRTLVPEIHVCLEMLRIFLCIGILTCVIYNSIRWTAKMIKMVCYENYRQGQCADTFSLLRHWQWSCSCLATCQHAYMCDSKTTRDGLPDCTASVL